MKIDNYLFFDDQCEAAMTFYAQCLGGTIEAMMKVGDGPGAESLPAEARNRIMHARLVVGDQVLMASDWHCGPGVAPFEKPFGFRVSLTVDKIAEAERVYAALAEGGNADMPLQKTFFAERFGMLTDRFGVPWMVNCEKDG
jgi:PhnB protein